MLIHLVRHGEVHNPEGLVYGALAGFGLSARGRQQADEVAEHLGQEPITAVWSSPLERALRTAEIIAVPHRLSVKVSANLIEWDVGNWTGIPWDELSLRRPGELEAYLVDPTDLPFSPESLQDLARRVGGIVTDAAEAAEGDMVFVGHQDPIQAARLYLTGRSLTYQHVERPGHASVITLQRGNPWKEIAYWQPE